MKIELTAHEIGYIQGMISSTIEGREIAANLDRQFNLILPSEAKKLANISHEPICTGCAGTHIKSNCPVHAAQPEGVK